MVYQRCMQMYAAAHSSTILTANAQPAQITSANSKALVVLSESEASANRDYIDAVLNIKLGKPRVSRPKVNNAAAYYAGAAHGKTVQLRRNLLGSS
jgi:hypothetical protein